VIIPLARAGANPGAPRGYCVQWVTIIFNNCWRHRLGATNDEG